MNILNPGPGYILIKKRRDFEVQTNIFFLLVFLAEPSDDVASNNIQLRSTLNDLLPLLCRYIVSNHLTSCKNIFKAIVK